MMSRQIITRSCNERAREVNQEENILSPSLYVFQLQESEVLVQLQYACYKKHELERRGAYERRITDVEHGTFTPLVLSTSGGWGPSATTAYKRLASLISTKISQPYSISINFIRCKIWFSLIDSLFMCLRGARSSLHCPDLNLHDQPLNLIADECNVK